MLQPWMNADDLAPGDARCATIDARDFTLHRIRSASDPRFALAFGALWTEFGPKHEMEPADVIARRLHWDPRELTNGCALLYELLLVTHGDRFVGVRDHTAIVRPDYAAAIVHLSHNLVAPEWRRSGIAGWLRALPAGAARACLDAQGRRAEPVRLVAEMEAADAGDAARAIRLAAYEKAGYRKIDPVAAPYLQPDFRPAAEIDASGGPRPLPLSLVVRFGDGTPPPALPASEVRAIVESLYRMYAVEFRADDMAPVWSNLGTFPSGEEPVALLPPTAVSR